MIDQWSILAGLRFFLALVVAVTHLKPSFAGSQGGLSWIASCGAFEAIVGFLVISGYSVGLLSKDRKAIYGAVFRGSIPSTFSVSYSRLQFSAGTSETRFLHGQQWDGTSVFSTKSSLPIPLSAPHGHWLWRFGSTASARCCYDKIPGHSASSASDPLHVMPSIPSAGAACTFPITQT